MGAVDGEIGGVCGGKIVGIPASRQLDGRLGVNAGKRQASRLTDLLITINHRNDLRLNSATAVVTPLEPTVKIRLTVCV